MNPQAKPFVPKSISTHVNVFGQSYQYNLECPISKELTTFLDQVINLTPHAVNYFDPKCHKAVFSLQANAESLVNLFRPKATETLYKSHSYKSHSYGSLRLYHDSTYAPLEGDELNDFFSGLSNSVVLIMSTISGKALIYGLKNQRILYPPELNLTILSPKSTLSVRDAEGAIIGVEGFNVMWDHGREIGRSFA